MNRIFILLILLGFSSIASAEADVWLQIDTNAETLKIKRGLKTLAILKHIAVGRKGVGYKLTEGDDITPLGQFKIGWINQDSHFRKFFGLNYPSASHAKKAFQQGQIDLISYKKIIYAHKNNKMPPQNTKLGGQIGIHGLGNANPNIHQSFNWTHGCIALTNRQIDFLSRWAQKGTRVEIK